MDPIQTGKFIAELRRQRGLTQEQLGERIGVTNKTVSRWETGAYLPSVDVLLTLGELFGVSVDELLSGRRIVEVEYGPTAEENLARTLRASSFTLKEKVQYYKKKWLREHAAVLVVLGACVAGVFVVGLVRGDARLLCAGILMLALAHAWRNNAMMTYVERRAYGDPEK